MRVRDLALRVALLHVLEMVLSALAPEMPSHTR